MVLLPVCYAPPPGYFSLLNSSPSQLEIHEHFIKQTYRNRCCIYGANGKLNLIIPVKHSGERTQMKDVKISNEQNWQKIHWRSLEAAYRTSSYFEYYEFILAPFYEKRFDYLVDFNLSLMQEILGILKSDITLTRTQSYEKNPSAKDFRNTFSSKTGHATPMKQSYTQVFSDKFGFIPGLSIFDLLFNTGPEAAMHIA